MYKVLLVEDEEVIRKGLIYMVDWAGLGCEIIGEAGNGAKGAEMIRRLQPDIVITDLKMPILSGIQMLVDTMEGARYEAIIISGYEDFAYAKTAIHLGVSEYLLKPLEADEVQAALQKAVQKVDHKRGFLQLQYEYMQDRKRILDLESIEDGIPLSAAYARAMVQFIKENYREQISIDDLSRKLMVRSDQLNQWFKDAAGYSFDEFLKRYRIHHAVGMLLSTEKKLHEIAEETGFHDYKEFIAVFKQYVGYAPMDFVTKTIETTIKR